MWNYVYCPYLHYYYCIRRAGRLQSPDNSHQISGGSPSLLGQAKKKKNQESCLLPIRCTQRQRPWRPGMPVAGLFTLFQSCTQQTKPGRTDWFRKMGRIVKTHVRFCWDLAITFLTPYPPSSFWSSPLELWLGIYYGAVGHLPPRACLNAFLHGQSFPVSTPALPALLNATRSLLLVWRLQWPPRRGRTRHVFPGTEP